jgi:hypothetical protein
VTLTAEKLVVITVTSISRALKSIGWSMVARNFAKNSRSMLKMKLSINQEGGSTVVISR